jgi:hypothetical protein
VNKWFLQFTVNIILTNPVLEGSVHTVKENADALVVANKEIGLEVNADITKYMVMSRDQIQGDVTV